MKISFTTIEYVKKDINFEEENIKLEKKLYKGKLKNANKSRKYTICMFVVAITFLIYSVYTLYNADISDPSVEVMFSALAFPTVILILGFLFNVYSTNYKEIKDCELMIGYLDSKLGLLKLKNKVNT